MRRVLALITVLILILTVFGGGASVLASEISSARSCSLRGNILTITDPTAHGLRAALDDHPNIDTVHLLGNLPDQDALIGLVETYPAVTFHFSFEVLGVPTSSSSGTLDLSGIPMEDPDAVEAALPLFHGLDKVIMCGCGLTNAEMDALNRKYPDVEFVWDVQVSGFRLRTDAKYLMPFLYGYKVQNSDLAALKYCTKLECIDFGHMEIDTCAVLENMPNLKYLILADTQIRDLTPLGSLPNLEFLEIFMTPVSDLQPLSNCSSLKDLNISWTYALDFSPLLQLPQLDRLWMAGCFADAATQEALADALPNTAIVFHSNGSTNKGWRYTPNYFRQRDIFGLHYMTG